MGGNAMVVLVRGRMGLEQDGNGKNESIVSATREQSSTSTKKKFILKMSDFRNDVDELQDHLLLDCWRGRRC